MHKKLSWMLLASIAVSGAQAASGPPNGYWMTAGDSQHLARYDQGVTSVFNTAGGEDYPIAVSGDVRTAASGQFANDFGAQYDLTGAFTGTVYNNLPFDPGENILAYDGATDGTHNYFMNYGTAGGVWVTNRDWTGMKQLFALGSFGDRLGITFDAQMGTIWTSGWSNGMIEQYDLNGNLLSSFDTGLGGQMTCLAMDYSKNTLWVGQQGNGGLFVNYDRSGTRLGSFQDVTLAGLNTLGGEFNNAVVPEPASMLALGIGLAALVRRRRTRN